jgi:hypothetical protein
MTRTKLTTRWRESKRGESAVRKFWELNRMNEIPVGRYTFHIAERRYNHNQSLVLSRKAEVEGTF